MGAIIINRSRVRKLLEAIDDPESEVYTNLSDDQKDLVERIRCKGPDETTAEDWKTLAEIYQAAL